MRRQEVITIVDSLGNETKRVAVQGEEGKTYKRNIRKRTRGDVDVHDLASVHTTEV